MTTAPTPALPFPVTPRRPGEPEPDLFGFRLIHRTLRSGCRLLADATTAVAAGEACPPARRDAIAGFARNVLQEVTTHHQREDDVLWPVIAASAGAQVDLEPLADDHTALHAVLERTEAALAVFAGDGPSAAGPLAVLLTELADELDEHIADEEAEVFPVITRYVSARDYDRCEASFRKGASLRHSLFVVNWALDQCSPAEAATLLASAPAPLRLLVRLTAPGWRSRRDLVRGP
jgi:hemerythrin-like domain-containing protein